MLTQPAVTPLITQLVLELADAVVRGPGGGAAQDQGPYACRGQTRQPGDSPPAHGLGDHMRALDAEVFEEGDEVRAKGPPANGHVAAGEAPATGIEGGTPETPGEFRHLLPPAQVVAACPVEEHDVRAVAMLFVVQVGGIHFRVWHWASVSVAALPGLPAGLSSAEVPA